MQLLPSVLTARKSSVLRSVCKRDVLYFMEVSRLQNLLDLWEQKNSAYISLQGSKQLNSQHAIGFFNFDEKTGVFTALRIFSLGIHQI